MSGIHNAIIIRANLLQYKNFLYNEEKSDMILLLNLHCMLMITFQIDCAQTNSIKLIIMCLGV